MGSLAATAGCITLSGRNDNDAEPATTDTPVRLADHDLPTCSETDDEIYEVSNLRLEPQPDENRVVVAFTIEYVGPDDDQFSVAPTINLAFYDDHGDQVGTLNQAETFSPTGPEELSYSFEGDGEWNAVDAFGIDVVSPNSDREAGCLDAASS